MSMFGVVGYIPTPTAPYTTMPIEPITPVVLTDAGAVIGAAREERRSTIFSWSEYRKVSTGAGWFPFVFERELVFVLTPIFSRLRELPYVERVEVEKASVRFTLYEYGSPPFPVPFEKQPVSLYINDIRVYSGWIAPGEQVVVEIPRTYITDRVQFRVEYGQWGTYSYGMTLEFEFFVDFRVWYVVPPDRTEQQVLNEIDRTVDEASTESVKESIREMGGTVTGEERNGKQVRVTVEFPGGQQGEVRSTWGTFLTFFEYLPTILMIVLIMFVIIEVIRVFRR
jgi:hypothetical protein